MKKYFTIYKPFLLFLSKFFLTYLVLTLLYQSYLNSFDKDQVDSITQLVAQNTKQLLHLLDVDFQTEPEPSSAFVKLIYNKKYIARLVEGCNAVSIVILFAAFIVSFSRKLLTTFLYIVIGAIAIYFLNIMRVALLCGLLYFFPEQEGILHRVFFPLFIYGFVFLLWLIWINKFFLNARKSTKI